MWLNARDERGPAPGDDGRAVTTSVDIGPQMARRSDVMPRMDVRARRATGAVAVYFGFRRLALHALAQTLVLLVIAACRKDTGGQASSRETTTPLDANATLGISGQIPARTTTISLDRMRVEIVLPVGWNLIPQQSDESSGLVAFAPDRRQQGIVPEQASSVFLDGTREGAAMPGSLADAVAEAQAREQCNSPADCVVLGREGLPGGGYLVSIKTPQSVHVESWRMGPGNRAVRCGAEMSVAAEVQPGGKTWLDDHSAVQRAQARVEAICRSAKPAS